MARETHEKLARSARSTRRTVLKGALVLGAGVLVQAAGGVVMAASDEPPKKELKLEKEQKQIKEQKQQKVQKDIKVHKDVKEHKDIKRTESKVESQERQKAEGLKAQ